MAYKYKERYLTVGSSWVDDNGFQHPSDWSSKWSKDDLAKWDISIEEDTNDIFDKRFYLSKGVAKSLTDVNLVDPDTGEINNRNFTSFSC